MIQDTECSSIVTVSLPDSGVARILGRAGLKSVEQAITFAQQSACALDGPAHISIQ